jgi:hypothetical protein
MFPCHLLSMGLHSHFMFVCGLSMHMIHIVLQDAYWSVNEEFRKGMDFSMFASGVLREEDGEISLREDEAAMVNEQDRGKIEETRDRAGDGEEAEDSNSLLEADEFYQTKEGGAEGGTGGPVVPSEKDHGDGSREWEERRLDLTISLQGSVSRCAGFE